MAYSWKEYRKNHIEDHRQHNLDYRKRHPDRVKKQQQDYRMRNRVVISVKRKETQPYLAEQLKLDVFRHYSTDLPTCLHCNEDDMRVLCIDHISDNGAEERRKLNRFGGHTFYRWLKVNDYPLGYQILCANCNMRKEFERRRAARIR